MNCERRFDTSRVRNQEGTVFGADKADRDQVVVLHVRLLRGTQDKRARWSAVVPLALEKRFVSQCAPEIPIGATSRQKELRYQQTAHFVLNRGVGRPAPQ